MGIVWLYSGLTFGFFSGLQYDARAMVGAFPNVTLAVAAGIFILGFLRQYRRSVKGVSSL